ncbi:SdiA-regulated [Reichenbachiella faecimaris]|uniref:SdiA-regulated n=1 Tax=Reichenbachiella faecimaris TaxID=692418 RepID=A0A1W2G8U3_REIFA|nr:SdiA-regulated domain-containing protein [Reichenbachiella faecimaris]SMD33043.1 SdiA-regulated [Reichenbachiella faecimaris]
MRTLILGLVLVLSCQWVSSPPHKNSYQELKLISVHQMIKSDTLNFDFSGITMQNDSIFIVADKPWNTFLYTLSFDNDGWYAIDSKVIASPERLDLEAIDHCDRIFYLANEYTGSISSLGPASSDLQTLSINFSDHQLRPDTWKNAGWEGLAIDCENQIMYLVKERQPRNIITVAMNTWKIIDQFDIPQTESNDFSDAKFENEHLYLLERNGNYVTKVNATTKKVVQKYHYKHVASHSNGKLYEPEKYGMAEALLLLENEIWIGLDNNGLGASHHAENMYQMKGTAPAILKFERPKGF